jgi:DNA-binding transcriptional regulator GbsR (MarR family)
MAFVMLRRYACIHKFVKLKNRIKSGVFESRGETMGRMGTDDRLAERDEDAVSRFVERFAGELTQAGMQRMAARVFAALLVSEGAAMTAAELGDRLRVSPAAVSGAVRYLTQVNMIGRERDPGSRRERYVLHEGMWYEVFTRRDEILNRWQKTLREGADTLGRDTAAGERLAETAEFFQFLHDELLQIMDRWRQRKAAAPPPSA